MECTLLNGDPDGFHGLPPVPGAPEACITAMQRLRPVFQHYVRLDYPRLDYWIERATALNQAGGSLRVWLSPASTPRMDNEDPIEFRTQQDPAGIKWAVSLPHAGQIRLKKKQGNTTLETLKEGQLVRMMDGNGIYWYQAQLDDPTVATSVFSNLVDSGAILVNAAPIPGHTPLAIRWEKFLLTEDGSNFFTPLQRETWTDVYYLPNVNSGKKDRKDKGKENVSHHKSSRRRVTSKELGHHEGSFQVGRRSRDTTGPDSNGLVILPAM
ncbi:hypothetical protein MNV49_001492 [Pseudohyphozyma bogoriensis]|nr:hypothetical protein MNV49_001492 [Pseudohyphozyma bogoriensis]